MIKWSDYLNKCFLLGNSTQSTDFIRSNFDYGVRQRRALRGYSQHSFSITLNYMELQDFKEFWDDLVDGTDPFLTDQMVHGNANLDKQVRFVTGYSISEIGYYSFKVTATIELMTEGTGYVKCPLPPNNGLTPQLDLEPC